ncbi:iron transporter [uncultured Halopseudomonas sp.]|uniref:iron transporter n=1 Tax=uncultured Halopseudomonas sp. TaxID=2901193 RepID=UPI0030EB5D18
MKSVNRLRLGINVSIRVLFALVGGYAVANLGAVAFAALLPLSQVDAALVSVQVSFALYACVVVWVFTARNLWWAIVGPLGVAVFCSPVIILLLAERLG